VCVSLHTTVIHNTAQNSSDNFPSYPTDNHHSSDNDYWKAEGGSVLISHTTRYDKEENKTLKNWWAGSHWNRKVTIRAKYITNRVNIFHLKCYNNAVQWTVVGDVGGGWRHVTTSDRSYWQRLIDGNVCSMTHHSAAAAQRQPLGLPFTRHISGSNVVHGTK